MNSDSYQQWQHAERDAHAAANELVRMLQTPGWLPADGVFERLRLLRRNASLALEALMCEYEQAFAQTTKHEVRARP